jgi:hypothetical protein
VINAGFEFAGKRLIISKNIRGMSLIIQEKQRKRYGVSRFY